MLKIFYNISFLGIDLVEWLVSQKKKKKKKKQQKNLNSFILSTFTTIWINSADNKLIFFFPENRIWHFMQTISLGDNLHEMSNPVFQEKYEKIFFQYIFCWKFYPTCLILNILTLTSSVSNVSDLFTLSLFNLVQLSSFKWTKLGRSSIIRLKYTCTDHFNFFFFSTLK